jgi:ethanolamine utilization protein EutA
VAFFGSGHGQSQFGGEMIVGDLKPLEEIVAAVKEYKQVLVLGCGSCVTVCLSGGEKEAQQLSRELSQKQHFEGSPPKLEVGLILRQCERDLVLEYQTIPTGTDAILSLACGAGAYSLSISGSSGFKDDKIAFPIRNVPVIRVNAEQPKLSVEHVVSQINISFQRFDLNEGDEIVALYFKDPVRASYPKLELFAKSIEAALPNSIKNEIPIILIFETDIACSVGNVIRRETDLKTNLLSLDELNLKEGDWIDIGEPLVAGQVFPVTVKSLVFH